MPFIEHIISLYAPHYCVGCGAESGVLLCPGCAEALPRAPSRCYKCKAVSRASETCKRCRSGSPLAHVYVATHYDDEQVRKLLHATKYERARDGIQSMVDCIVPALSGLPNDVLLVPVPTASSRVRQRGYDQAVLLAHEIGVRTNLHSARFLARIGQAHQVGAGRTKRIEHLKGAFRSVHNRGLRDAHIVLVDDVLTTGATLETAARVLKQAGVAQVDAIVFAQA